MAIAGPITHPRLRSVETIFVPHETIGRALLLRDGEGIASTALAIHGDTALRVMPRSSQGVVLHYEQCVDPEEGSMVSHASVAFYE